MKPLVSSEQESGPSQNRFKRTVSAVASEILTLLGIAYLILSLQIGR